MKVQRLPKDTPLRKIGEWIFYPDVIDYREDLYLESIAIQAMQPIPPCDIVTECEKMLDNSETKITLLESAAIAFKHGARIGTC